MSRILIIGSPKSGKTTLSKEYEEKGLLVRHTDDTISLGWSEGSAEVAKWLSEPYDVIEGVSIPRALRKWRENNPNKPAPCEKVIILTSLYLPEGEKLSTGQESMRKGLFKVWNEIEDWVKETSHVEYQ